MPRQLSFDYPVGISFGGADFWVSDSNRAAYAMIRAPEAWPAGKLALIGPEQSGKTHLARVFADGFGAQVVTPSEIPRQSDGPVVVEDLHELSADAQEDLFHLHNNLRATGQPLLLTSRVDLARLHLTLPDLESRLRAATPVRIEEPDDELLTALILKLFADRQMMPAPDVIAYIVKRMDRSFAATNLIVDALDREAFSRKSAITRPVAAAVLDSLRAKGT